MLLYATTARLASSIDVVVLPVAAAVRGLLLRSLSIIVDNDDDNEEDHRARKRGWGRERRHWCFLAAAG